MNREIKFRLRRDEEIAGYEKWFCGELAYEYPDDKLGRYWQTKPCWLYSDDCIRWTPNYILHNEKDAFTGLLDKQGKEIYEGDLLTYPKHKGYYLIRWVCDDEDCGFECVREKPYNYMLPCVWKKMKVIGNILEEIKEE